MIPKIIHYIWLGGNPLPKLVKKCIKSWKKFCPGYEIKLWNEENLDLKKYQFAFDAYNGGKYAFASDVFRFDILSKYGGIYLDVDVQLCKPLDSLLNLNFFTGFEKEDMVAPGLIMGAEPNNKICLDMVEIYKTKQFDSTKLNENTICILTTKYLMDNFNLKLTNQTQEIGDRIKIFATEYFCPKDYITREIHRTKNTISIHHYLASWTKKPNFFDVLKIRCKKLLKKIVGEKNYQKIKGKVRKNK